MRNALLLASFMALLSAPVTGQGEEDADASAAAEAHQLAVGAYRQELGRLEKGTVAFQTAADGLCRNLRGLGSAYYLLSRPEESIAAYTEAIDESMRLLGKENTEVKGLRGKAYNNAGKHDLAVPDLEAAIEANRDPDLLYELAVGYRALDRRKEAIALFEEILKARSDDYNTAHLLAHMYSKDGQHSAAAYSYLNAIKLLGDRDPKTLASLYNNLGNAYTDLCRRDEARDAFKKAAAIDPKYTESLAYLAYHRCSKK